MIRVLLLIVLGGACDYNPRRASVDDASRFDGSPTDATDATVNADAPIDAQQPTIGPDLPVTANNGNSSRLPSLVWTGALFGLAWQDQRDGNDEVYFARLDADGTKQGSDVRVTNQTAPSGEASLVWTGTEFGVAWQDERDGNKEIYFARIDANGVKQGVDIRVTIDAQNSERPSLVWTGTEFVVAWQDERDGNKEIYLVRLNALGVKLGTDIRVTNNTENSERPSFAWTGTELALAWQDERDGNKEIYCARFAATGVKQGTDIRITNDGQTSERPSLVSTGSELGIAWQDERDGNKEVYFTRLTPLGIEIGDDLRVTANGADSKEVSLLWTGAAFAASWTDARDGNDEIYFATRGAAGEPRTGDARTTTDAASSKESSLAGSGTMLGIAWTDARTGSDEIFFQAVSL